MSTVLGRAGRIWLGITLSVTIVISGAVVAGAAVAGHGRGPGGRGPVICRPDGRRTVLSRGVGYIVRNDVFSPEQQCIKLPPHDVGFVVTVSHARSYVDENDAFPEIIYGCEWGVCSWHTTLPRKVYLLKTLTTSWSTSWHGARGCFNVAYDIWFGHLHLIHGQAGGAELMIWLGEKSFSVPSLDPVVRIDGQKWYYARHRACDAFGCWNYVLFRRVVPTSSEHGLNLLPFINYAQQRKQISWRWFLRSVDAGFEIWRFSTGLETHSFSVLIKVRKFKWDQHRRMHPAAGHHGS